MSKHKRGLSAEEAKLWRAVVARVKPRRPGKAKPPAPDADEPSIVAISPLKAARPKHAVRQPPRATPAAAFPPANRGGEKRVRRGNIEIDATLDLHGHTQATGRAALARFLTGAHARGARTVIVITGAGRAGQGVLRRLLPQWLALRELKPLVSGFAQAHRAHGGDGAFYVFLKRGV